MPTTVLILDNDPSFASELAIGLRSLGAEATIVEDPNQGLQYAASEHPNLIVLAVELHKMNGFSVCSRIKKEPTLSGIPVVLTTSNSTDVTIEQHRQRPNHADDYVRKPIAIPDLIERLAKFAALRPSIRPSGAPEDDGIVIDDETVESRRSRPPSMAPHSNATVDSDVSIFTDNAFDGIMTERGASVRPRRSEHPPARSAPRHSSPEMDVPRSSPSVTPPSVSPNSESARMRVRVLEDALEEANTRIRELESRDLTAKDAELESLRRELDEARTKLIIAGRGGTPSVNTAREVLDLREQLHKKEKELLDSRDRLTQREKELLGLKDNLLAFEREKADLSDRFDDIARQLTETQRHAEVARSDKDTASKRADDAKRRVEKLTLQLEEKAAELDSQRASAEAAANEHATEKARWLEAQQAAEERAAADLRTAMAQASSEINGQAEKARQTLDHRLADAKAAAEQQLQQELERLRLELNEERALALTTQERELSERLKREHGDELERLRSELDNQRHEGLEQLTRQHNHELDRLKSEQAAALQTLRNESEASLESALQTAKAERERSEHERDEQLAATKRELEETALSLSKACDHIATLERQLEHTKSKSIEDRASIERTKDALAAALVQLEAIEQRALEEV